ncbi:hypothetical protein EMPS_08428 [Entomortierella parvispora]|uniref:PHD-type domain-containing protein n=1 Tax=Entomortierella parvispora TaxID=205924 RepID=A0A9P3HG00_9FUNG|nr:hypothetical protein EMPS_08428 [Entomortierella parvispora]
MTATPSSANGSHRQPQPPQEQTSHGQQPATAGGTSSKKPTVRLGSPSHQPTLSAASWGAAKKPSAPLMMTPSPSEANQNTFAPQPLSTPSVNVQPVHGPDPQDSMQASVSGHFPESSKESSHPPPEVVPPTTTTTVTTATKSYQAPKLRAKRSLEGLGPVVQRRMSKDDDDDYKGKAIPNAARSAKRRHHKRRSASAGLGKALDGNISGSSSGSSHGGNVLSSNNNKRSRDPNASPTVKKTKMTDHRGAKDFSKGKSSSPGLQDERRPPIIKGLVSVTGDEDALKNNNDYCETCLGLGQFICCDTCPRAFHFSCCHPPLDPDNLPDEWHCNECEARLHPPVPSPNGIFKQLLDNLNCMNPRSFALPADMRKFYKNVETNSDGEYVDSMDFKPEPPAAPSGSAAASEAEALGMSASTLEALKIRDKKGEIRLCFHCHKSAVQNRMMASCDHCPLHWHLDCLDPPMAAPPPSTRKWMCPNHVDHLLPRRRKRRDAVAIKVTDPYAANNGDIEIIEEPSPPPSLEGDKKSTIKAVEMMDASGVVYRIPERSIKLNFFQKCESVRSQEQLLRQQEQQQQQQQQQRLEHVAESKLTAMETEEEEGTFGSNASMLDILAAAAIACDGTAVSSLVEQQNVQDSVLSHLTSAADREDYLHFRALQRVLKEKGLEDQVRQWVAQHDVHRSTDGQRSEVVEQPPPLPPTQQQQTSSWPSSLPESLLPSPPQPPSRILIKPEKLDEGDPPQLVPGQRYPAHELHSPPEQQARETVHDATNKAKAI